MSASVVVERTATVPEQYETLRTAALGEGLPVEARSGLALFLRRGMWGWAQAAAVPSKPSPLTRSSFPISTADDEQQTVIHLFAAMAMSSTKRRAHERIAQGPVASPRA
jgi:hypothetical protein